MARLLEAEPRRDVARRREWGTADGQRAIKCFFFVFVLGVWVFWVGVIGK